MRRGLVAGVLLAGLAVGAGAGMAQSVGAPRTVERAALTLGLSVPS